jgi:hypothetical protein
MIGRVVLVLLVVALLMSLLITLGLPRPVAAQDPLPTPVGQLGGRMPLPTAEGLPVGSLPQDTPTPSGHPLIGAWLLTFAEPDQAPAQALFGDDGIVTVIDGVGNRGAGVWIPSGEQSGLLALVVREAASSGRPPRITVLQGPIDVSMSGDAATLVYTIETVAGAGATAERAGPFTAVGQRVDEQLIVPTPE